MIRTIHPEYRIVYLPHAEKEFLALPKDVQKRVDQKILTLQKNPRPSGIIELKGFYRLRIGDYRVIYEVRDDRLLIIIIQIGHRREIYKRRRKK
ncbi:MAG: type II toxin-antitoxin system RelE/ParE family toxin [Candidatus Omnitrophota bacterium]|jgi:mRNA interferase RelE/StbE|nr:MAG: type II toxin-antitoxin system RelE/ParE family toxin [Candidatus Omnitrophota bacterium]